MPRFKNTNWEVKQGKDSTSAANCEEASLAVLMDIRDELQKLNAVLACPRFLKIPDRLVAIEHSTLSIMANAIVIAKNTKKVRRKKAKKA